MGILVPENDAFVLEKRIPARVINDGDLSFSVLTLNRDRPGFFYPVNDDLPFLHIEQLGKCVLKIMDGEAGVFILD